MKCEICTHENRLEIERALMNLSSSVTIDKIAEDYNVSLEDLKIHALFHTPLGMQDEQTESIVQKLKLSESNMLSEVAIDYMITLKNMSNAINKAMMTNDPSDNAMDSVFAISKIITKPVVELYLGLGAEVRKTVSEIAEIDNLLNGPKEDSTAGLAALVNAINASK